MTLEAFQRDLESLINRYSRENGSNTPDFVLAQYLTSCLIAFDATVNRREVWYGRDVHPITSREISMPCPDPQAPEDDTA